MLWDTEEAGDDGGLRPLWFRRCPPTVWRMVEKRELRTPLGQSSNPTSATYKLCAPEQVT